MKSSKYLILVLLLVTSFMTTSCGSDANVDATQDGPTITLSLTNVSHPAFTYVTGTGFTPNANVTSRLIRPDGTEFPFLPLRTDQDGGFYHDVDSLLLLVGEHQLWVLDDKTGVTSNVARFTVTREQSPD